jgi:hypothetical protein
VFGRKGEISPPVVDPKLIDRAASMDLEQLFSWSDISLSELTKYFSAYRSQRDPVLLHEAQQCAWALSALLEELETRKPGVEPKNRARQVKPRVT